MRSVPRSPRSVSYPVFLIALVLLSLHGAAFGATVNVIEIRSEISKGLATYIERALKDAERSADVIVFDMHTPGGRVDAMGDIVNAIFETEKPTIAYVRTEAISAGAVIALASDQIVMAPGSTIGDAAPVSQGGEELGEKVISYIRGKIRATAERNGRNPAIAEAMVDKKKVLVRSEAGVEALTPAEFAERKASDPSIEVLSHEGELLTLTTDAALDLGFVELRAVNLDELLAAYSLAEVDGKPRVYTTSHLETARASEPKLRVIESLEGAQVIRMSKSILERLAIGVTGTLFGSLLLSIGMVGILIELRTPGFGIPGIAGILSLALFFGGHMLAEVQASYGLLAFLIGLVLLALEIFVIPGFGVAGISGIALMVGGLLFVFGQSAQSLSGALTSLSISILGTITLAVVLGMALPKTRAWNRLILGVEERSADGYRAPRADLAGLLGLSGTSVSQLRPAGVAEIGGQRVDVVADGEFIASNQPVEVVQVEGVRVVVRRTKASA